MANAVEHKVCIVTGAARGLGGAIARDLANEGGQVVVADINVDLAETVAAQSPSEKGLSDRDCCDSRGLRDLIWSYHVDPGHPAAA